MTKPAAPEDDSLDLPPLLVSPLVADQAEFDGLFLREGEIIQIKAHFVAVIKPLVEQPIEPLGHGIGQSKRDESRSECDRVAKFPAGCESSTDDGCRSPSRKKRA